MSEIVDRFVSLAQSCRSNEERALVAQTEESQQQARMWGVLAKAFEEGLAEIVGVPEVVRPVIGNAMTVLQKVPARTLRQARDAEDRTVWETKRTYVPYSVLADLADTIETAYGPDVWDKLGIEQ